jgi:hypothetical protein
MGIRMPADVAEAIVGMDGDSRDWSEETRDRWSKIRRWCFTRDSKSQQSLPAMSIVAQEAVAARDHAQRAVDAMAGLFGSEEKDEG